MRDSSVFDSHHSARLDTSPGVRTREKDSLCLSTISRLCVSHSPTLLIERGKRVKKSEGEKRCKKRREEESAGKGGGCWDEGYSREIQMHLKPKSAKATVGKREANREGNMLPGKMN